MSNIYLTRSMFDIARNDELNIQLVGMWYRHSSMEYWVFAPEAPKSADSKSRRFHKLPEALAYFEQLTAGDTPA